MALGTISLTATLNSTGKWVLLSVTCTGMTHVTLYRVTPDGSQAVRSAFNLAVSGAANVADYEAPQNTTLAYYARVTDGSTTTDSMVVTVTGVVDRGGDCVFGLTNPLATTPVTVVSFPELRSEIRRDVVNVIGRRDPVVVSDVRQYPSGTLTVATLSDGERLSLQSMLADGGVIAFSPKLPTYGFSDIWYLSVGNVNEQRLSPIGHAPERSFIMDVQRVAPPPADFIGPAFRTWQQLKDAGVTWNSLLTAGTTWLEAQVVL